MDWFATDASSGVNHNEISLDNGEWINVATKTNYTFTGLSDGTHMIAIMVVDNADNSQTASRSITVNVTSSTPQPTSTSPSSTPTSTLLEGGLTTWLVAEIMAVAIATTAIVIGYRMRKKSKAAKRR